MRQVFKIFAARCLNGFGIFDRFKKTKGVVHILMFHKVDHFHNVMGLSVSPHLFEELIVFLKNRYELISMDQAIERLTSPDQPVGYVLTFDDGYRDNYDFAYPILVKHNVPATIFVTFDALDTGVFSWDLFDHAVQTTNSEILDLQLFGFGKLPLAGHDRGLLIKDLHNMLKKLPDSTKLKIVNFVIAEYGDKNSSLRTMLSWEEAREMANSGLVSIGAHTVTHPILSRVDSEQAHNEIIAGKSFIEERLGLPVYYFAYPNGSKTDFNDEHVAMVKRAGYRAACATIAGSNNAGSNLFTLRRIDVTTGICTDSVGRFLPSLFLANLSGWFLRGGA